MCLKKTPHAWYDHLSNFLLNHGFTRGIIYTTLFVKRTSFENIIIQIYVDNIILGSANISLCNEFSTLMQSEFEMSIMGS